MGTLGKERKWGEGVEADIQKRTEIQKRKEGERGM